MASSSVPKVVLKNTTNMSLNERFTEMLTSMQPVRVTVQATAESAQEQEDQLPPSAASSSQSSKPGSFLTTPKSGNRKLVREMESRPSVRAALALKADSLKQRLGKSNIRARLGWPFGSLARRAVGGWGGTSRGSSSRGGSSHEGTSRGGPSRGSSSRGGSSHEGTSRGGPSRGSTSRGGSSHEGTSRGGPSRGSSSRGGSSHEGTSRGGPSRGSTSRGGSSHEGTSRGSSYRERGLSRTAGARGEMQREQVSRSRRRGSRGAHPPQGQEPSKSQSTSPQRSVRKGSVPRVFEWGRSTGHRGRSTNMGRGQGLFEGGSRRHHGVSQAPLTKEQLDSQLDAYMAKSRGHLDAELDAYMAQTDQES